jgi:hypothetical protein
LATVLITVLIPGAGPPPASITIDCCIMNYFTANVRIGTY